MIELGNKLITDVKFGSVQVSEVYAGTIKVWPTNPGLVLRVYLSADNTQIKLPVVGNVDVTIKWGDGSVKYFNTDSPTHIFTSAGLYDITLTGNADIFSFESYADSVTQTALEVVTYNSGFIAKNIVGAFANCISLVSANINELPTSSLTTPSLKRFFYKCYNMDTVESASLDTSNITSLEEMFYSCQDITDIELHDWDVSKVTSFRAFAYQCSSLKYLKTFVWDTDSATDFSYFAANCSALQYIQVGHWKMSKVTTIASFASNCAILPNLNLQLWDTSSLIRADWFLGNCHKMYDIRVGDWDVSKVERFDYFIYNCYDLLRIVDYDSTLNWVTTACTDMENFANQCSTLETEMPSSVFWGNANITSFSNAFAACTSIPNYGDIPSSWK